MSDFSNEVITFVDMFGPHLIVVIFNESERGLVVAKERGRSFKGGKEFE